MKLPVLKQPPKTSRVVSYGRTGSDVILTLAQENKGLPEYKHSIIRNVKLYDKDHMSELWIKNRSESDLRSCEVT